jgi:hypothetical protein
MNGRASCVQNVVDCVLPSSYRQADAHSTLLPSMVKMLARRPSL